MSKECRCPRCNHAYFIIAHQDMPDKQPTYDDNDDIWQCANEDCDWVGKKSIAEQYATVYNIYRARIHDNSQKRELTISPDRLKELLDKVIEFTKDQHIYNQIEEFIIIGFTFKELVQELNYSAQDIGTWLADPDKDLLRMAIKKDIETVTEHKCPRCEGTSFLIERRVSQLLEVDTSGTILKETIIDEETPYKPDNTDIWQCANKNCNWSDKGLVAAQYAAIDGVYRRQKKESDMSPERTKNLLDGFINCIRIGYDTIDQVEKLTEIGFTPEELVQEFRYDSDDIAEWFIRKKKDC